MGKVLLEVLLPANLIIELRNFCKPRGILINHFVAKAVIERLKEEKERRQRAVATAGRFHSGKLNLSAKHNEYLAEAHEK